MGRDRVGVGLRRRGACAAHAKDVQRVAEHVVVLEAGRVTRSGVPAEVLSARIEA